MKSTEKIALLLAALLLLSCLGGCAASARQSTVPYKVFLISKSTQTEFWKSVFAGARAAKSEYNIDLTILGPKTEEDYEVQNDYIRRAVDAGADAIVFSAISYTENAPAIDEAIEAGLKVVIIDSDVASEGVSVRIGTDNVAAGRISAEAALDTDLDRARSARSLKSSQCSGSTSGRGRWNLSRRSRRVRSGARAGTPASNESISPASVRRGRPVGTSCRSMRR